MIATNGCTGGFVVSDLIAPVVSFIALGALGLGDFYLVLTDEVNTELPWWMPSTFFKVLDSQVPRSWVVNSFDGSFGKETTQASPDYFSAEDDIEDGTDKGHKAFKAMKEEVANL